MVGVVKEVAFAKGRNQHQEDILMKTIPLLVSMARLFPIRLKERYFNLVISSLDCPKREVTTLDALSLTWPLTPGR